MKYSVKYGTKDIEFSIEFKNRKTMSISVKPPNNITVVAPVGTSEEEIKEAVKSKGSWIVQKLFEFRNIESKRVNREFVNGESFMYLGRNYSLQIMQMKLYRIIQVLNYLEENFMYMLKKKMMN